MQFITHLHCCWFAFPSSMFCRHHTVMASLQQSTHKHKKKCRRFHSRKHRYTRTLPAVEQCGTHENGFNWLEGRFWLLWRDKRKKEKTTRKRKHAGPWKRHFTSINTLMLTQAGMPRHLTPRHKHHCFALNIVPITDSYWDRKGRRCYDESSTKREQETEWQ